LYPQSVLDAVYLRPDANLGKYTEVLLETATVEFDREWPRAANGRPLSNDPEEIIADIHELYSRSFSEALQSGGTLKLVSSPGPYALRLSTAIGEIQVYRQSPEAGRFSTAMGTAYSPAGAGVYVGDMVLDSTLTDSITGATVVRLVQSWSGRDPGTYVYQPAMPYWWHDTAVVFEELAPQFAATLDSLRVATP
jgi:hypothetical protein